MQALNFIPFRRLEHRRRRSLRRRWLIGCGGYACLVAAAGAAALAIDNQSGSGVQARLAAAGTDMDRVSADVSAVRVELDRSGALLRSSRAIAEQPDWSLLMALLAARAGDDVTLRGCSVRPRHAPVVQAARGAPQAKAAKPVAADPTLIVNVSGLGASQSAVSQFALRLESTGLFNRVTLLDTTREPFADKQLVAFRIECTLAEPNRPAVAGPGRSAVSLAGGGQ